MGVSYSPKIVTDGLVLCLDAANPKSYTGSGTNWSDLSGNDNNGELYNGATFDSNKLGSILLDGVNDYVESFLHIADNNFDYTINIVFNITAFTGGDMRLFGASSGSSTRLAFGFVLQTFRLWLQSSWNNTNLICETDTDYSLVIVHTGTTTLLYVNGILNSTIPNKTSFFNTIGLGVPYLSIHGTYFNGNIYQISIYNRAITSKEVLQNYNATKGRFGL